jgi:hypothetical protein
MKVVPINRAPTQLLFDFAVVTDDGGAGCGCDGCCCCDCCVDTIAMGEFYAVSDAVWQQANPGFVRFLCIGCLERRLGRKLVPADFLGVPINKSPGNSDRMNNRLSGLVRIPD